MIFDKEKTRRAAEKSLSQGKIQAAIKEYCQIVKNDPKDFNTLNMLGDLYVRVESKAEAVTCFRRIADYYDAQGFAHKAIAVYKKILRLQPDSVEISAKLAPLYHVLGLVSEARSYYLVVAENYKKNGDQLKALEIWSRIADLDPNDTATRLKLAENYLKENEPEKAAEAFAEAGNRLLAKKQIEEAAAMFAKALELFPLDVTALNGATSASIALGFPDEAAERLEKICELHEENSEVYSLLAHAYIEAGNVEAAENAVSKLVEREPTSYSRYLEIVRLYLKENRVADAARALGYCGELLISNNQEEELLHWIDEVLARDPEQLLALRLLTRVRAWQRNEDELKNSLERLAEAAQLNNAEEEERGALIELSNLFPEDERYVARLQELGGNEVFAEQTRRSRNNSESEFVPTFESFDSLNDEAPSVNSDSKYPNDFQSSGEPAANGAGYSANPYAAQNSGDEVNRNYSAFEFAGETAAETVTDFNFVQEDGWRQNDNSMTEDSSSAAIDAMRPQALDQLVMELESVDFYIAQSYFDLALETLHLLETQYGIQPIIQHRLDELAAATAVAEAESDSPTIVETQPEQTSKLAEAASAPETPAAETTAAEKFIENHDTVFASSGFEDLFAELGGEDIEVGAIPTMQTADYETHYNLGLAYKEMGLMDDAVEEFQSAVKMAAPGDGTPRYLQCCNLIGHCFMEKEMPKLAIMWYQRGVDAPGHTDEEYQALRYELGMAYEKAGEAGKALELFTGIYAVNVAYRNTGEKVRNLQAA